MKLFIPALIITIFLEATVTALPLTLLLILAIAVIFRRNEVFLIAFFAGLLLDILTYRTVGFSSLYFSGMVFAILLYQRKFEIESANFIFVASIIAIFGYLFALGASHILLTTIASCLIIFSSFTVYLITNKKEVNYR